MWSTGPVGNNHRAVMRDGKVVAIAESVEEAAHIVRTMNGGTYESYVLREVGRPDRYGYVHVGQYQGILLTEIISDELLHEGWRKLYVQSE